MTAGVEESRELLVKQMTWEAEGVISLILVDPDGKSLPEWSPGAHIDLTLRDSLVRQYSLCGDPDDLGHYRIAVLRESNSQGGSRFVHEGLRPGHRLLLRGPRNNFEFLVATRYVFIAGGIGITPILPMVRVAVAAGAEWELFYGGRHRDSMAFVDELADFGSRVHLLPEDEVGRLDLASILAAYAVGTLVYCCGPEGLLAAVEQHAADWAEGGLRVERFKAKSHETPRGGERAVQLVLQRTGRSIDVGSDCSLLDALEAAGIPIDSSCRDGICGTCETKVLDGVPDHRDSVLSAAEQATNKSMMLCVSRAKSDRLVLDL